MAGTPEYLVERFEHFRRELGIGHLLLQGHESQMDAPTTWRSIELIGQQVLPALAKAWSRAGRDQGGNPQSAPDRKRPGGAWC